MAHVHLRGVDCGSFRDPAGYVYTDNLGTLLRHITAIGINDYEHASKSGLHTRLFKEELLIPHTEIKKTTQTLTIKPVKVPAISYPFEWSFDMLKDAALCMLAVQKLALSYDMSLKDASAYNIQFLNAKPILIDTLSFETYKNGAYWSGYGQFCRHFLSPLLLMSYTDTRLLQLLRIHLDGLPLDLTYSLLPRKAKMKASVFMHVGIHAKQQQRLASKQTVITKQLPKTNLLGILDNLERMITKLQPHKEQTEWMHYYKNTNYNDVAAKSKKKTIEQFMHIIPSCTQVVDLGGNDGHYSRLFSHKKINTICADIDPHAVNYNYIHTKKSKDTYMTPLLVDLTNPGGNIGWQNNERSSVEKRLYSDVVMALALVHHLAISNNVPLTKVAECLAGFGPYLIIEFVPKEDSQVRKLLATRADIFPDYTEDGFEKAFSTQYSIIKKAAIKDSKRSLYVMKVKHVH